MERKGLVFSVKIKFNEYPKRRLENPTKSLFLPQRRKVRKGRLEMGDRRPKKKGLYLSGLPSPVSIGFLCLLCVFAVIKVFHSHPVKEVLHENLRTDSQDDA